jgi:hypothetical protein
MVFGCDGEAAVVRSPALVLAIGAEARVLTLAGEERGVVYTSASVKPVRALAFDPVRDLLYSMQGPTMVGFFVRDGVEHRAVIRDERYRSRPCASTTGWDSCLPMASSRRSSSSR